MARSASHDKRLVAVFDAIRVCEQRTVPVIDWTRFYGEEVGVSAPSYVGPVAIHEFEGRGLGLIATCKISPGEVVLIEDSFGLSSTPNGPIQKAKTELVEACCNKLGSVDTPLLYKATFWCLHSEDEETRWEGWKQTSFRKSVLHKYFDHLNSAESANGTYNGLEQPPPDWGKSKKSVASVVSLNSRKTERWNPWTLLLDESKSLGGLWLAASLFNHSCLGNIVVSYGAGKACRNCAIVGLARVAGPLHCPLWQDHSTLVARAAAPIEKGEARCFFF